MDATTDIKDYVAYGVMNHLLGVPPFTTDIMTSYYEDNDEFTFYYGVGEADNSSASFNYQRRLNRMKSQKRLYITVSIDNPDDYHSEILLRYDRNARSIDLYVDDDMSTSPLMRLFFNEVERQARDLLPDVKVNRLYNARCSDHVSHV